MGITFTLYTSCLWRWNRFPGTVIPFVTGILTQFTILSVGERRVMSENDRPFTSFFATHVSLTQSLPAERSLVATLRSEERWTPKERETRDVRRSRSRNSLSYRLTISFTFLLFHLIYSASPPTYHLHPTHHMRPYISFQSTFLLVPDSLVYGRPLASIFLSCTWLFLHVLRPSGTIISWENSVSHIYPIISLFLFLSLNVY